MNNIDNNKEKIKIHLKLSYFPPRMLIAMDVIYIGIWFMCGYEKKNIYTIHFYYVHSSTKMLSRCYYIQH